MAEPLVVEAFIEIPAGSQNKYEWDKEKKVLRLDRVLYSPVHYPTDYGFVPETLEQDGDPIDILVLITNPTVPGCLVEARIIGVLTMVDDKGVDNKLLGVPIKDPRFVTVKDLADVPPHVLREVEHFFRTYKDLEGKQVDIRGWQGAPEAHEVLGRAKAAYHGASAPR
jgi:inorganic pyrophosphatase